jgi:hypothetical protein
LQEAGDKIKSGWSSFADFMGDVSCQPRWQFADAHQNLCAGDSPADVQVWTEITSTEVPTLENKNWGIGVFITNIFLPGMLTGRETERERVRERDRDRETERETERERGLG